MAADAQSVPLDRTTFLAYAVAAVRDHGYVPAGATDEEPTWRTALARMSGHEEPATRDLRRAHEIVGWTASLHPRDPASYRSRLAACLDRERLGMEDLPLAASAVRAFNLHLYYEIRGRKVHARREDGEGEGKGEERS